MKQTQRYLLIALTLANIILMSALVYIAPVALKTANVAITLSALAQADHDRINALEKNLIYYTDPETVQNRTIDFILRQGEFKDR